MEDRKLTIQSVGVLFMNKHYLVMIFRSIPVKCILLLVMLFFRDSLSISTIYNDS